MAKTDDPYITFLKYAREKMREGEPPHFTGAFDHVRDLHPEFKQDAFQNLFFQSIEPVADQEGVRASYRSRIENKIVHVINMESYFNLLEHEELQEARESSAKALNQR